jgi:large subunit ribosomal protein L29
VGEPWVPPRSSGRRISLKAEQLRSMTDDELERALAERRQELFNLRFQSATGALENPARLKLAKREIARILTIRHERESTLGTR